MLLCVRFIFRLRASATTSFPSCSWLQNAHLSSDCLHCYFCFHTGPGSPRKTETGQKTARPQQVRMLIISLCELPFSVGHQRFIEMQSLDNTVSVRGPGGEWGHCMTDSRKREHRLLKATISQSTGWHAHISMFYRLDQGMAELFTAWCSPAASHASLWLEHTATWNLIPSTTQCNNADQQEHQSTKGL